MEIDVQNDHAQRRDSAGQPWTEGGLLSPMSKTTVESERYSLRSPSLRNVQRRWTDDDRDHVSRAGLLYKGSDGAISSTASDKGKHAPKVQPSLAVDEFREFINACQKVERYLESFTHQVQKLGSASVLVKASRELHDDLSKVREFFEENAQNLGLLLNKIRATKSVKQAKKRKKRRGMDSNHPHGGSSISENTTDNFIGALHRLARSVKRFLIAIIDFEDYNDDEGNKALQEFEIDLRVTIVLSGGLEFFSADGESHELRRFVTARATSLKVHLDNLSKALTQFENIGIPCISFAQKRSSRMLLNAATVATFFAGVAATTLQYSVELTSQKREIAMNTLWFMSLVLSIGAAITGMLAMTWRLAVFSSPKRHLPWYIRFWIRSGYMALLIASVMAFLAGLVIYVFDTMPRIAFWIVTACTVFCVLGLAVVSVLFLKERYSFTQVRHEIRKELNPMNWQRIYEHADEQWWYWFRYHFIDQLRKKRRMLVKQYSIDTNAVSLDKNRRSLMNVILESIVCLPWKGRRKRQSTEDFETGSDSAMDETKRPQPWKKSSKKPASAQRRGAHSDHGRHQSSRSARDDPTFTQWYNARIKQLGLNLSAPLNTRALHLQFSPNGSWLVFCHKFECFVYNVERSFEFHTSLSHAGKKAKQVEWCPNSTRLITRTKDFIKVWYIDDENCYVPMWTVRLHEAREITDIQWLSNGEFLAIANDLVFYRVDVTGDTPQKTRYEPEPENRLLEIYYLYTLPDSELVIIVGARNIEGLTEEKAIDCIIVYEMQESESEISSNSSWRSSSSYRDSDKGSGIIRRRIPLLHELESLSVGRYIDPEMTRRRMVISYLDKPPETWIISTSNERIHLSLERELVKKVDPGETLSDDAEWGEAFLIGPSQGVVACAEDGVMYFWDLDQTSREQFHRLRIIDEDEEVEELPLVSWIGPNADNIIPMMATAGKGLALRVWTPLRDATVEENLNELGGNDKGIPRDVRENSDGHRLLPSSDYGRVLMNANQSGDLYTPPQPLITLPEPDVTGLQITTTSPNQLDGTEQRSQPLAEDESHGADDDADFFDDKRLGPASSYCTSPESSAKDFDEADPQETSHAND